MKRLNPKEKEKILQESYEEGCIITELGKKYGISEKTVYGWRRRDKKQQKEKIVENSRNFIEVAIKEDVEEKEKIKLRKAELVYEKFRVQIEGEISSRKIGPIVQILEGE